MRDMHEFAKRPEIKTVIRFANTHARVADNILDIVLHKTAVVSVWDSGSVFIASGGWRTATTKKRINEVLDALGLDAHVYQERHKWYLSETLTDGSFRLRPFTDNMMLTDQVAG